jgi:hypothetical protein
MTARHKKGSAEKVKKKNPSLLVGLNRTLAEGQTHFRGSCSEEHGFDATVMMSE